MQRDATSRPAVGRPARRWPVRAFLVLLAAALTVPGLVFSGVLLTRVASTERSGLAADAQSAAKRTADTLDRDLVGQLAMLRALASSPALAEGDLRGFETQARSITAAAGAEVLLSDLSSQVLLDTRLPYGASLPRFADREPLQRAIEQRRPVVSDLYVGAVGHTPRLSVNLPVPSGPGPAYVLTLSVAPERLSEVLAAQRLPREWALAVVDGRGVIIARSGVERPGEPPRGVGAAAAPDLRARATGEEGQWTEASADGTEMFAAYARVPDTEWRVAVGVPVEVLEAPLRRGLRTLIAVGAAMLALSCGLAWIVAASVARPLGALAEAGLRLGRGERVGRVRSPVAEVDDIARVLHRASSALMARTDALAAERARLAAVFEAAPVGIVIASAPSGRLVDGNAQADRILGHTVPLSDGLTVFECERAQHRDGRTVAGGEHPLARALTGEERPTLEFRYRRGNGALVWLQSIAAPIRDPQGGITGAVVALLDVDEVVHARERSARFAGELERVVAERTARLEQALAQVQDEMATRALVEDQLRQAHKMESVGRLTGGIAHDFNNLLTIVVGSLDLLRRRVDEPRAKRLVDSAMDGATRAAALTARLLAFSRRQPLAPRPLEVNDLVAGMADLLCRTLGATVRLATKLDPALQPVYADQNQLENAVLNLAMNARDAMAGGRGTLTIRTGNVALEAEAAERAEVPPGDYVAIEVSDTGIGMAPEVMQRAFEPFFTTKSVGQGTGLGLSQVHGFVKQSGGHVSIGASAEPGVDSGTTVRILLPRHHPLAEAEGSESRVADIPVARAGEAVLIVEDEAGVRRFSGEALRELGYGVVEASDAEAALAALEADPGLGLLFTDVVLPGADGYSLAAEALRRRPGLQVLFTSGHDRYGVMRDEPSDQAEDMLTKPFTLLALATRVRELLDRGSPAT